MTSFHSHNTLYDRQGEEYHSHLPEEETEVRVKQQAKGGVRTGLASGASSCQHEPERQMSPPGHLPVLPSPLLLTPPQQESPASSSHRAQEAPCIPTPGGPVAGTGSTAPLPSPPLPPSLPRDGSWLFLIFPSAQSGRGLLPPPKGSPSELWARQGQRALQNQDNLISLPQAAPWKTGHSLPALVPGTSKLALRGAGEGSGAQASGILLRPVPTSGLMRILAEVRRPREGSWEVHATALSTKCGANVSPQCSSRQLFVTGWAARAASMGHFTDKEMEGEGRAQGHAVVGSEPGPELRSSNPRSAALATPPRLGKAKAALQRRPGSPRWILRALPAALRRKRLASLTVI